MSDIVDNWTIDGELAPWATHFRVGAIDAILPLELRTVKRLVKSASDDNLEEYEDKKVWAFVVHLPLKAVVCCAETSYLEMPLEDQKIETERMRASLIKAWSISINGE